MGSRPKHRWTSTGTFPALFQALLHHGPYGRGPQQGTPGFGGSALFDKENEDDG